MKFSVRITKTIVTDVEVESDDRLSALRQIRKYGLQEAISDYPVVGEQVFYAAGQTRVRP